MAEASIFLTHHRDSTIHSRLTSVDGLCLVAAESSVANSLSWSMLTTPLSDANSEFTIKCFSTLMCAYIHHCKKTLFDHIAKGLLPQTEAYTIRPSLVLRVFTLEYGIDRSDWSCTCNINLRWFLKFREHYMKYFDSLTWGLIILSNVLFVHISFWSV